MPVGTGKAHKSTIRPFGYVGGLPVGLRFAFQHRILVGLVLEIERRDLFAASNWLGRFSNQDPVHSDVVTRVQIFRYEFVFGRNGPRQDVAFSFKFDGFARFQRAQRDNHIV